MHNKSGTVDSYLHWVYSNKAFDEPFHEIMSNYRDFRATHKTNITQQLSVDVRD